MFKNKVLLHMFFVATLCIAIPKMSLAATGHAWIGGAADDAPYDLSVDHSGTGWSWVAKENKLALDKSYTYNIHIDCDASDVINLEVNDAVKISDGTYGSAIVVAGSLNIYGTGSLTLVPSTLGNEYGGPACLDH